MGVKSVLRGTFTGAFSYAPAALSLRSSLERFVILCPGRCGSELLADLLRSQIGVVCDGEILHEHVRFPTVLMEAHAQRRRLRGATLYGCKVLVGQLPQTAPMQPSRNCVRRLARRGWVIVGLVRRNVLRQSLSWQWAAQHERYHRRRDEEGPQATRPMTVDPDELIAMMHIHHEANSWIDEVVRSAHRSVQLVYEDDLERADDWQRTVSSVMGLFGVSPSRASSRLARTSDVPLSERVENFDEVVSAVRNTDFAPLLPEACE